MVTSRLARIQVDQNILKEPKGVLKLGNGRRGNWLVIIYALVP